MDMIYKETFHAAKVAYVVNMMSSSYVQVSKEHIMSRIAGKTCKLHQTFQAAKLFLFQIQNDEYQILTFWLPQKGLKDLMKI